MSSTRINLSISVVSELERLGVEFRFIGTDQIKCVCPFHPDKTPSCTISINDRVFKCHAASCQQSGDFITFMARVLHTQRHVVVHDLQTRYSISSVKIIDASVIERNHSAIFEALPMMRELNARGIFEDTIRQYRLGYARGCITIPVYDVNGVCVNLRRYKPGAPTAEKMRNVRGHGAICLYPRWPDNQFEHDKIVLCGGELKALVTASLLNKHSIGAISATSGEGNWSATFTQLFTNKIIYICMDIDTGGKAAALKLISILSTVTKWVGIVKLPLNIDQYPSGDVNDWVGREGAKDKDFLKLLKSTPEWKRDVEEKIEAVAPIALQLDEVTNAKYVGKRVKVRVSVSSMDTSPYAIPKEVSVVCDRSQPLCAVCPIFAMKTSEHGICLAELPPESPALVNMINAPAKQLRQSLMEGLGIPACKVVDFKPYTYYSVQDTRVTPMVGLTSGSTLSYVAQPAFILGNQLELNESYILQGRIIPHPRTQMTVLLASEVETVTDALSTYKADKKALQGLTVFQPDIWTTEGVKRKLKNIYADFAANVTHIYMRDDLHLALDLGYHSALHINGPSGPIRGWTEILVLGDSSQGKSEAANRLRAHFQLGDKVDCKNATVAGLLGGVQQHGTRWFVTWGAIPLHDRRLVILEELKGASTFVISKLTDMRSSGIAEIPKIERRQTNARTRLIALSNPRSDKPLSSYGFGVEAIRELIGALEDIRRFDAIFMLDRSDIPIKQLTKLQTYPPQVKHVYTSELCKRLILWAWTRTAKQIKVGPRTKETITALSTQLCQTFSEAIPIVDVGSMQWKLTRLATAIACRTFSTEATQQNVVVRPCHVEYIAEVLTRMYSSDVFGYLDFSNAIKISTTLVTPKEILQYVADTPFPADLVGQLLSCQVIEPRDIQDFCSWDRDRAAEFISFMVRKRALKREGRGYVKTGGFIALLKSSTLENRPAHIGEKRHGNQTEF